MDYTTSWRQIQCYWWIELIAKKWLRSKLNSTKIK
jgi:hypothetical protein